MLLQAEQMGFSTANCCGSCHYYLVKQHLQLIIFSITLPSRAWFQMGHGLMAVLLEDSLKIADFPNGSSVAFNSGALFLGQSGRALVAASGPMGPPLAGAALILFAAL